MLSLVSDARTVLVALQEELDYMGELSQELQVRLQEITDRRSKLEAAISNLEKKLDDTESSVAGNLE